MTSDRSAADRAASSFVERYGRAPRWVVTAPGRVNLIGEHTDYNDGFVLPMALEGKTAIAAGPDESGAATFYSAAIDESTSIDLRGPVGRGRPHWSNYVRGVVAGFQALGPSPSGCHAVIESDVPPGSGLSSSAALEVSVATLFEALTSSTLAPTDKARLCQRAEHEFVGVPTGIMDQLTSVMATEGHALLIDCRSLAARHVPMTDPSVVVLIVNTNVRHDLATSEYARRHAECQEAARLVGVPALRDATPDMLHAKAGRLGSVLIRRARHVVSENDRTLAAADALEAGDWPGMGELMYASHASLRDDYAVSCDELDLVVSIARKLGGGGGVFGARMTGGGFGRSVVCLVHADAVGDVTRVVGATYEARTAQAATIFSSRPGGHTDVVSGTADE